MCHWGTCEYSHLQQPAMSLYIRLWQRLNSSETLKATGAGSKYIEAAGLTIEQLDVLCELDDELLEYRKEKEGRGR